MDRALYMYMPRNGFKGQGVILEQEVSVRRPSLKLKVIKVNHLVAIQNPKNVCEGYKNAKKHFFVGHLPNQKGTGVGPLTDISTRVFLDNNN